MMATPPASAAAIKSDDSGGLLGPATGLELPAVGGLLDNGLPKLPLDLLKNPTGTVGQTDNRDFGTPTSAPGKVCTFTGNVPVSLPLINSPVGSSLPGLGGYTLDQPAVDSSVYSELCMSEKAAAEAKAGKPPAVLILVHGITYGTWYWDSPYQPAKYSVVNDLVKEGYATLNIDRIGEGRSGHPLSALVTPDTNAETVHQLIGKLRGGQIGGVAFPKVGLVGHSYGSVTSYLETSKYNDADVVIATGYANRFKLDQGGLLFAGLIPAALQKNFPDAPWKLDPGYLSFRPGARANSPFFYKPNLDPAILTLDEKLQSPVTATELGMFVVRDYDGTHKNIKTPTFIIMGEHDSFFCGSGNAECETDASQQATPQQLEAASARHTKYESTGFTPQACLRTAVIPDAGHNINFHRNSDQVSATIDYFADQALGTHGENERSYRANCPTRDENLTDLLPETERLIPPTNLLPLDGLLPLGGVSPLSGLLSGLLTL
jgi:pimeloyl-ACP methyl ester carboxylesterase